MTRKPGKKQKEKHVGCTGEGKKCKGNIREGSRDPSRGQSRDPSLIGVEFGGAVTLVRLALKRVGSRGGSTYARL